MPTIYVLSKNKKNIIFTAMKNRRILHDRFFRNVELNPSLVLRGGGIVLDSWSLRSFYCSCSKF